MRKFIFVVSVVLLFACTLTSPPTLPFEVPTSIPGGTGAIATLPQSNNAPATSQAPQNGGTLEYIAGSSQRVCQLTGETDHETHLPTASQTSSRFGMFAADLGYSFEHDNKLFFLFGDSIPGPTFNHKPNSATDLPRIVDDDAIGSSSDTNIDHCVKLNFITDSIGAYKNPVVLNAQGSPAITLRENEIPISGISDGGKMFVIFGTDNYLCPAADPCKGQGGFSTRTVVGESDDDANTFHYLYDFSKGPDAKFINVAIASASDGYIYFWGTQGGSLYRKSASYLARKPNGSMNSLSGLEYLHSTNSNGTPVFMSSENDAAPMFHDCLTSATGSQKEADCMGELGVNWNLFVKRWVMLYNCDNNSTAIPRGILMRSALQPWGPWSPPQTIFNPIRDAGICHFIYQPNPTACNSLSDPGRLDVLGGVYAPYFLSRFTTGDSTKGISTFFYTMATWNPYGQVIMKTTVQLQP